MNVFTTVNVFVNVLVTVTHQRHYIHWHTFNVFGYISVRIKPRVRTSSFFLLSPVDENKRLTSFITDLSFVPTGAARWGEGGVWRLGVGGRGYWEGVICAIARQYAHRAVKSLNSGLTHFFFFVSPSVKNQLSILQRDKEHAGLLRELGSYVIKSAIKLEISGPQMPEFLSPLSCKCLRD